MLGWTFVGTMLPGKLLGDTVGAILGCTMVGTVVAGGLLGEMVCSMVVGCPVVGSKILGEIVVTLVRNVGMWDGWLNG